MNGAVEQFCSLVRICKDLIGSLDHVHGLVHSQALVEYLELVKDSEAWIWFNAECHVVLNTEYKLIVKLFLDSRIIIIESSKQTWS